MTHIKKEIKFSFSELVCPALFIKNKEKIKLFEQSKKLIINKISIESLIEENYKINQLANILLSDQQLRQFNNEKKVLFDAELLNYSIKHNNVPDKEQSYEISSLNQSEGIMTKTNVIKRINNDVIKHKYHNNLYVDINNLQNNRFKFQTEN